jgi:hypothetical protein
MILTSAMKDDNFYAVLGISPAASLQEIKKAYRKLALQFHPDMLQEDRGDESTQFKLIHVAYKTLSNKETRIEHDRALTTKYGKKYLYKQNMGYVGFIQSLTELNTSLHIANKNSINFDYLYLTLSIHLKDCSTYNFNFLAIDPQHENSVTHLLLNICTYLPYKEIAALHDQVLPVLSKDENKKTWIDFLQKRKWAYIINRYTIWIVLFISLFASFLIMVSTK